MSSSAVAVKRRSLHSSSCAGVAVLIRSSSAAETAPNLWRNVRNNKLASPCPRPFSFAFLQTLLVKAAEKGLFHRIDQRAHLFHSYNYSIAQIPLRRKNHQQRQALILCSGSRRTIRSKIRRNVHFGSARRFSTARITSPIVSLASSSSASKSPRSNICT